MFRSVLLSLTPPTATTTTTPSSVQGSVSSLLSLIKTVICSSTWVTCLYSQSRCLAKLFGYCFFFFFFLLLSSPTLRFSNRPVLLFDVGSRKGVGVYSGVVSLTTDAATTLPLMLCPSAARCWSSIREATVPNLRMNRGPIDGARLWGAAVSPLLHAQAGVDGGPGRLPAGEKRGWPKGSRNILA